MKTTVILIIFSVAIFSGCKKSSTSTPFTPTCTGATKSWVNDVKPVLTSSCSNCHASFTTYSTVYNDRDNIRSKIIDGSMPQSGTLTTDQKNIVICWIDNGSPNN